MGSDEVRSKAGLFRRVGRGVRKLFDVFDFIEVLITVGRLLTAPFRLLARLSDAFW